MAEQTVNEEQVKDEEVKEEEVKEETQETASEPAAEEAPEDNAKEELAKLKDTYLRTLAEYDNYRKRTTKEKEQAFGRGACDAVEKILPVVDNFERALAQVKDPEDGFAKGVTITYNQMMTALAKIGVTPIDALGQSFDPHFHMAVMHVDDENAGENEIVEVFQTGYMYKDTLLRPASVKVAN